ncbi:hypothetical protein NL676_002480 [Syzygium grande]|nr:hypothetical protein NL676_002480 [Syzygium grande]
MLRQNYVFFGGGGDRAWFGQCAPGWKRKATGPGVRTVRLSRAEGRGLEITRLPQKAPASWRNHSGPGPPWPPPRRRWSFLLHGPSRWMPQLPLAAPVCGSDVF